MPRVRLVELASTGHVVVVEAQAGAGKSTLLSELAEAHDGPAIPAALSGTRAGRGQLRSGLHRSLREGGLSDLAAVLEQSSDPELVPTLLPWLADRNESLLVLIDEVHRADDDLVALLARLVEGWPAPHRLVLAGRRLPGALAGPVAAADGVTIGPSELRFVPEETCTLLGERVAAHLDDSQLKALTDRCDGWAAAITLVGARLQQALDHSPGELDREIGRTLVGPASLADLLGSLMEGLPDEVQSAVKRLACLPWLDETLVLASGLNGGIAQLADLGLPLQESDTGRWSLPNAVRDALASDRPDEQLARLASQRYLEALEPGAALEVLEAAHLDGDLALLLADQPPEMLGRLDPAEHAAAVGTLPTAVLAELPRILIQLGDAYVVSGELEEYRDAIVRARSLLPQDPDLTDPSNLEVVAADVTMRAVASDDDRLVAEAERLLTLPALPPMARARLLGAVGRATASRRSAKALRVAVRRLDESAQAFQREGASVHAIAVRVIAATFASFPLGRYDAALSQLDQALAAGRGSARVRVAILPYRAFILIDLGRYAEAEAVLAELRHTATAVGTIGNERSAAFARWGAAKMASQQGDADATYAACRAVERSDAVVDTGHGAFFRADAAQLLARVGRFDEAQRLLGAARDRDPGKTGLVATGQFAVAAYLGDLERAEAALDQLDGGQAVEPRERWRVTLLHAYVRWRAGDQGAQPLAAAAFEEAAQLGYPELPFVREPQVARQLVALAAKSSASAREALQITGVRIRLLGTFEVEIDGRSVQPSGRPGELVALLALRGPQLTAEQVIEALWPNGDISRGRERLRTVLRRVRRDLGELIERHDDTLRLAEGVTVDAAEFLEFTRRANDPTGNREAAAKAALALYRGEVAPALTYQEWAIEARRHLDARVLDMHDLVAAAADADGRLDDAIRANLAALERDPAAEFRYLAAARCFAEQGRRSRALALLADARRSLGLAGLQPSDELVRLEGYLQRAPTLTAVKAS